MHPICSWMVAVDFGDTLRLKRVNGSDSSYEILIADDAPGVQQIDWPIESDLAFRAHGLIQQHVGRDLPIEMALTKRIPSGAGLGGGSSDAAGMLIGINQLFDLSLSEQTLFELGMLLGSDVGFLVKALCGTRSALVSGVGEQIEAVPEPKCLFIVLIFPGCPGCQCATAEVYQRFDEIASDAQVDSGRVCELASARPIPADGPFNDLAEPAMLVRPELREALERVQAMLGTPVHVSGSGSAMYVLADSTVLARDYAQRVEDEAGLPAVVTHVAV